jgi:hypothetical protein
MLLQLYTGSAIVSNTRDNYHRIRAVVPDAAAGTAIVVSHSVMCVVLKAVA